MAVLRIVLPYIEQAPEYLQPLKDLEDSLQSSIRTAGVLRSV